LYSGITLNDPVMSRLANKHVAAVTSAYATVELLLEAVFCARSVQMGYKEDNWGDVVCCQLIRNSAGEAVKIEPERMKLKFLSC
jgi:hypothetical protein